MNPRGLTSSNYDRGFAMDAPAGKSEFDLDLENAEEYFGRDFPGNDGLTCQKCGAAVNLGWKHIAWHEATGQALPLV
jgi:hypothetical protein